MPLRITHCRARCVGGIIGIGARADPADVEAKAVDAEAGAAAVDTEATKLIEPNLDKVSQLESPPPLSRRQLRPDGREEGRRFVAREP